ncbi:hypothetical protein HHI36_009233 [Cryptolaemus montrouzieri]|uniref:Uncharacterized protein n=1 Tax=Cryptolaemus montrouzieri TaxID=559131 RepID=A0ABD2MVN0_9CUCU
MSAELERSKRVADEKNKNLSNVSSSSNEESQRSINKMNAAAVEDNFQPGKQRKARSVKIQDPDVDKWIKRDTPWRLADKQQDHHSDKSVIKNLPVSKSISIKKVSSSSSNRQTDHSQAAKFLTRQSLPRNLPSFDGNPLYWPNFNITIPTISMDIQMKKIKLDYINLLKVMPEK